MARPTPEHALTAIEAAVAQRADGASAAQIEAALAVPGARRTLQYRLRSLVDAGRLRLVGEGRAARYQITQPPDPLSNSPVAICRVAR